MRHQHKTLPPITGRTFFVGDIHAHYHHFLRTLAAKGFRHQRDRVICTGDLVDKGNHSFECLRLLKERWFFSTLGNHEEMLLDEAKTGYTHQCWFNALSTNIQNHAVGLITEFMPYTYTVEIGDGTQIGVVHAHPPLRGWALDWQNREQQEIDVFLWRRVRRGAVPTQIIGADGVVFGHNNVPEVTKFGSSICIDTLMETGRLSILEAREVLHAIKSTD